MRRNHLTIRIKLWGQLLVVGLLLLGCGQDNGTEDPSVGASPTLPPLPTIETEALVPEVRAQFEALQTKLSEKPWDGRENRDYAELLHAYSLYQPAAVMYERCQLLRPNDLDCRYLFALVQKELGNNETSIESLKALLARQPNYVRASVVLANSYRELNLLDQAIPLYQREIKKRPENLEAQFGLAQALINQGDFEGAKTHLTFLHSGGRNFGAVHSLLAVVARRNQDSDAAAFHTAAAKRFGSSKIPFSDVKLWAVQDLQKGDARYVREANAAFQAGNLREAAQFYEKALSVNTDNTATHSSLVGIYGKLGEISRAQSHFDKAIAVNPSDMLPYINLGTVFMQRGDLEQARSLFAQAIERDEQNAEALTLHAYCDQLLGGAVNAEAYQQALDVDPTYQLASYLLARHTRDTQSCKEALPLFRNSVRLIEPTTPSFKTDLAACLIEQGELQEARKIVDEAIKSASEYGNQNALNALRQVQQRMVEAEQVSTP